MNSKYIAGFFDGEGSGMILTIHRKMKTEVIYRFRPVIKISQKTDMVLELIENYIGYGHINRDRHVNDYTINGLEGVLAFIDKIAPHCYLKEGVLLAMGELAKFQQTHTRNIPYTLEDTIKMLDIRDKVFELNKITRTGLRQKYPREQVLAETTFVGDIRQWQLKRAEKGAIALEKAGKPYRFKKKGER